MADKELQEYRNKCMHVSKVLKDKEMLATQLKQENTVLKQEVFCQTKDLSAMGAVIEEHS